jgi:hypothetical protein
MIKMQVNIFIFWCFISYVNGHGRLWDPPGRSTMFRKGFNTPHNYNDNQLYCGGFSVSTFIILSLFNQSIFP